MKRELLSDATFKKGFLLQDPNAGTLDRNVTKYIHFGNERYTPVWYMAQWWTPFNFKDAPIVKSGDVYSIDNESRHYSINTKTGRFEMGLDASLEYKTLYDDVRRKIATPWSHFLIEQDFEKPAKVTKIKALRAHVKFKINEVTLDKPELFDPSIHAAQLLWYVTINSKRGLYSPAGRNFIWFGIPLYDSRSKELPDQCHPDIGSPGSTDCLICSLGTKDYLPNGVEIGKEYVIDIDIWPKVKEAIEVAKKEGIFREDEDEKLNINYMNFGWELPGSYKVSSVVEELSLEVEE